MNELNVRNGVITCVAVLCKGKKKKMKEEKEKQVDLKKIEYSGIWDFTMCRIQNQIKYRNNVSKQKITSKIYDIDTYFYEHYKERIRFDKNVHNYLLFRIVVYVYYRIGE